MRLPEALDNIATLKPLKFNEHSDSDNLSPHPLYQFAACLHGPSGGEQIVHHQHTLSGFNRIGMDLDAVLPILKFIADAGLPPRQLPGLSHRHEPRAQGLRHRHAEDEPAALRSNNKVHLLPAKRIDHQLNRQRKPSRITDQRREILKQNPRLWEIRHIAYELLKSIGRFHGGEDSPAHCAAAIAPLLSNPPVPNLPSPMSKESRLPAKLEVVEPIGDRVLIRKDEDKKQTKTGIHLPDKIEIPTITGRVVAISTKVENDADYPIRRYDKVLFNPKHAIPVEFEGDNRLFVIPVEDVVAVFRKAEEAAD